MLQVRETSKEFELAFEYEPQIVSEIKRIGGGRWNPVKKIWTLPKYKREDVESLREKYGHNPTALAAEVIGFIPELPDLERPIDLKRPLYKFQEKGVAYTLKHKRVIMGDQPGLGKTSQAIAAIVAAKAFPCLIICPASLKYNWQNEWQKVAGMRAMILEDRVKSSWPQYHKVGMISVFIVNYESLKKYFVQEIRKPEGGKLKLNNIEFRDNIDLFKSVVIDELHRCKDGTTQQAKYVMGIAKGKEWILGLTGTPVVNTPKDLVAQLNVIQRLRDFGGYKYFINRYCDGGRGSSNLKELNYRMHTTCFFQRQKSEVLTDLPDKMRQIMLCDITTREEYKAALSDLAGYLKEYKEKSDVEIRKSLRGEIMVKIGICKNISARGKLNEVFEYADEVLGSGEKLVIFIHQKQIAEAIIAKYPHAVTIRGADSPEERQRNVDAFQNNPAVKLIVCNIKAGGVGITLTAASRVAFVELPWHSADADQCEDRCHRIGQKDSVQATYFLGHNTIDEDIYKIIESKRSVADQVTGSDTSVQQEIIDRIADHLFKN